jgi:hypothetical protein
MLHHVIRITEFEKPMPEVRRQVGRMNVGIYCHHCGEFIALAVLSEAQEIEYEFAAERPVPIHCPSCGHVEHRRADEITQLVLTETNLRQH